MKKFCVSRDDSIYEAWPDLILTPKGDLLCVFSECAHHGDRTDARFMLTRSCDRGRTWSPKQPLTEKGTKEVYWNCARLSALRDGTLILTGDYCSSGNERENKGKIYYWKADPEGINWEGPFATPAFSIMPDKLLELQDGAWVLGAQFYNENGYNSAWCWRSEDKGKTWSDAIPVANQDGLQLCEINIREIQPGVLVAMLRENSGEGKDGYKCLSRDGGKTWKGPFRMPLPGLHRPTFDRLQNGVYLVTYRFMQGGKGWLGSWTQNAFAALLSEESLLAPERREQSARILPLDFDRSPVSDGGYTGWAQFPDGEIYVVNYIVDDAPKAQIRGYSLHMEDFLLP